MCVFLVWCSVNRRGGRRQPPSQGRAGRNVQLSTLTLTLDCRFGQHRGPGTLHSTPGDVSDLGEMNTRKKTSQTNAGAGVIGASRPGRPGGRRAAGHAWCLPGRVPGKVPGRGIDASDGGSGPLLCLHLGVRSPVVLRMSLMGAIFRILPRLSRKLVAANNVAGPPCSPERRSSLIRRRVVIRFRIRIRIPVRPEKGPKG
ncbi:hypothetical protein B0T11DRAFT_133480 [Plectosphaerella cucumerina]|uniref:Uncharacterized protein n=1 Tax=Plectosphaerella cucumerina TaxID=40658 RepID=A0A8K0T812_9PEZI|nr:hypothetical protein B0T11DRAFT_133480 [Plectosphaerella cucumerina]